MSASQRIEETVSTYRHSTVFDASTEYTKRFQHTTNEANYYKVLERLVKRDVLGKLDKGVYYIPKRSQYGTLLPRDEHIVKAFMPKPTDGMEIGYGLYQKHGLTTQVAKRRVFYTNQLNQNQKRVSHMVFHRKDIRFTKPVKQLVELLEVLQHFSLIEDLNYPSFMTFAQRVAKTYNDATLATILKTINHKKSTLAFLAEVLDAFGIPHCVQERLSTLSQYRIPKWRHRDDFTSLT